MRLVTYERDGELIAGALLGEGIVDLSRVAPSVLAIVEGGAELLAETRALVELGDPTDALSEVRLSAPIPRPRGHLYCIGWNYPKHYEEGVGKRAGQEVEARAAPTFFSKPRGTVVGPYDEIAHDGRLTDQLDYEAELAVVIGRSGRSIPVERVAGHIFGYTLANDVTARDIQRRHGGQWLKGKGMDTYCPLGPVLVTADEIPDPGALTLRCRVNGNLRQEARVGSMIYPIDVLVSELSHGMTLYAGEIVLTGTPPGVGFAREPQVFLRPGDVVEVEIDEIGRLENPVRELELV